MVSRKKHGMQEEYRRYQRIERLLLDRIHAAEHATRQLALIPPEQHQRYQDQRDQLHALHATIRTTILTAEELLKPEQLHRLQRRVNEHNPGRWQHYRDYKPPL